MRLFLSRAEQAEPSRARPINMYFYIYVHICTGEQYLCVLVLFQKILIWNYLEFPQKNNCYYSNVLV